MYLFTYFLIYMATHLARSDSGQHTIISNPSVEKAAIRSVFLVTLRPTCLIQSNKLGPIASFPKL